MEGDLKEDGQSTNSKEPEPTITVTEPQTVTTPSILVPAPVPTFTQSFVSRWKYWTGTGTTPLANSPSSGVVPSVTFSSPIANIKVIMNYIAEFNIKAG
jgi:hypothetical protein